MTCHHRPATPREIKLSERVAELPDRTPNPDVYDVLLAEQVGENLVMIVQYTSCTKCSYDAKKVMVFQDVTLKDAIRWKRIDPHFSDSERPDTHAPSPCARFPASEAGLRCAMAFAASLSKGR